jgi:hypothetical protein
MSEKGWFESWFNTEPEPKPISPPREEETLPEPENEDDAVINAALFQSKLAYNQEE